MRNQSVRGHEKNSLLNARFSCYSAFLVCDRIGRIWATRQLCVFWIIGAAIFMGNNGHLGAVYAGRFIAGLGVGQTVVVAPVYLAEIVSSGETVARWGVLAVRLQCILGNVTDQLFFRPPQPFAVFAHVFSLVLSTWVSDILLFSWLFPRFHEIPSQNLSHFEQPISNYCL